MLLVKGATYYYRLKQKDFDGTTELSRIIAVKVPGETSSYAVYPNPASGKFTFSAADANISSLKMFSITGYPVGIRAKQAGADNSWDIETKTTVAPGLYYIQFTTGQGAQETLRMIIR